MNNKNLILIVGFVLLAIIGYQGYLLYQKDNPTNEAIIEKKIIKKDEPEVTINIDKTPSIKTSKSVTNPTITTLTKEEQTKLDQERIEDSIQDLFQSIFASKGVQDGLVEFKKQAQLGMKELQQGLQELPAQLDKLSDEMKDDPFFSQLFEGLKGIQGGALQDMGDHYQLEVNLPDGKNSKIDIQTKDNFLTISTKLKERQTTSTMMQSSKNVILIPSDAIIENLTTKYENNTMSIIIPKKGTTK